MTIGVTLTTMPEREGMGLDKFILYHDLLDAMKHHCCPVCAVLEERMERAVKVTLQEGISDDVLRKQFLGANGYCNHHAWKLQQAGHPVTQSSLYRELFQAHREALDRFLQQRQVKVVEDKRKTFARIRELFQKFTRPKTEISEPIKLQFLSGRRCPLCESSALSEARYVEAVAEYYEHDEQFRERYRNRGVLCQPHLWMMMENHGYRRVVEEIVVIQQDRLESHIDQLHGFVRQAALKHSEEDRELDRSSWVHAIRLDVGMPGTNTTYKRKAIDQPYVLKP